jgi:hypothetical protein
VTRAGGESVIYVVSEVIPLPLFGETLAPDDIFGV